MLTEQIQQFNEILEELGKTLDISESQYNAAVKSYNAVGNWLKKEDSFLSPYLPEILPQGSFMLGTMVKPLNENDDLDIDLVCQLKGKNPNWTQEILKQSVGDQIKANDTYKKMLDEEGRRCWTLLYRQDSYSEKERYHMDILPCVVDSGYRMILDSAFSAKELIDANKLAIRITDNLEDNYETEKNHLDWLKSNPFGYAKWFENRANISSTRMFSLNESIKPVPKYQTDKLPLQRVVQILKCHRDMMFNGDKEKPISIIITTLAAYAYRKQANVYDALVDIIDRMHLFIEERRDPFTGEQYRFIGNPVNSEENFADKWRETPRKEEKFNSWLKKIKEDINLISNQRGRQIMDSMSKSFGESRIIKTFSNIGDRTKLLTEQGNTRFDTKLGIMAGATNSIKPHNFYGTED
ncbi:MAG TPA: nucleotidyltransferase [Bacteroidales bacterium]